MIILNLFRLDGRNINDFREVSIHLSRNESTSSAEVTMGGTQAIAIIKATICKPYRDRPTEGIIQINTNVSYHAQNNGISRNSLSRYLEKSIKENDAIDTESLCIIAGQKVWMITCEIELLNYNGSSLDACMLACIAALRSHRRPEITVLNNQHDLKIHHSDEREPLSLALHHTPLAISLGFFSVPAFESLQHVTKNIKNSSTKDSDEPSTTAATKQAYNNAQVGDYYTHILILTELILLNFILMCFTVIFIDCN